MIIQRRRNRVYCIHYIHPSPSIGRSPAGVVGTASPREVSREETVGERPENNSGELGACERALVDRAECSAQNRRTLRSLIRRYGKAISCGEGDLGRTSLVQHRIETGGAQPVKLPPRRLPQAQRETVDRLIREMLHAGVIEPASGPWSSPVVLVRKKDGSPRFCVDYRRLNAVTRVDAQPIPRIDDTLDALAGAKWFSTLDLASGYWQVEVADVDRVQRDLAGQRIQWKFIPPRAPWMGGYWERLIRTMKESLRKVLGQAMLDEEELRTVLCEVEACFNARPLTCTSSSAAITLRRLVFASAVSSSCRHHPRSYRHCHYTTRSSA
ncbi:Transposon Ty3-G Gag-Pol polyprotein [Trichinella sp. T8]|nr:Transposon Ty3-G Gag-Pol polyprotein [Trichinella sp. T8]